MYVATAKLGIRMERDDVVIMLAHPGMPSAYLATEDRYFDSVSKIRMSSWSRGHVTLLGDATSCVSLFGDGSSSAMEGAATLAASLTASPNDIPAGSGASGSPPTS